MLSSLVLLLLLLQILLPCAWALTGFGSQREYLQYLHTTSALPAGFQVGTARFNFQPFEVDKILPMNLTLIIADQPTDSFAAMFTSNEFCGGPIIIGKERVRDPKAVLQAIVVNNKISNVCPGAGVTDRGAGDSDTLCEAVAKTLKLSSKNVVFPSSTGIIGWRLPVDSMKAGIPIAASNLQSNSILPAALGITTTDRYPKIRRYTSKNNKW